MFQVEQNRRIIIAPARYLYKDYEALQLVGGWRLATEDVMQMAKNETI